MPRMSITRDARGVTAVEFALLAPVLILLLMGLFDLGHQMYARALLTGAMQQAGRESTMATTAQIPAIDAKVKKMVGRVVGTAAVYNTTRRNYTSYGNVGQPERFSDGAPANGQYDPGECFEDINGNGHWDADLGTDGQGTSDDVVQYTMTVTYPRLFPMAGLLGWPAKQVISATTLLRNQPADTPADPPVPTCP